ncbi:MAG TPA: glucose-6-phosphate isomerase [Lachnospiraceae bacterium]|nr:glucose-6-phosphate isomerase [Lachnospiraceae bacterium]
MIKLRIHTKEEKYKKEYNKLIDGSKGILGTAQKGEAEYADSQGWLDTEEWAGEEKVKKLEKLAAKIRQNADVFVLIGVGGSNNAARAVIKALQKAGTPDIVYAGNTLSPHALNKMLKKLAGKSIYVNCIAKNFETLEPGASFRILRKYLQERYGSKASERIIATGTAGSSLERLCTAEGYTFLEFPDNIGGRYTAISNVGLLPMAVAGIDIRELVQGAGDMQKELHAKKAEENAAFQYACLRNLFYRNGYKVEMLSSFEPQFRYFYKWWIQLFAESEGKDDKGIFPVAGEYSEELHSVGQFLQEGSPFIFETFLDVQEHQDSLLIEADGIQDYFDYLDGKDFWDVNKEAYKATVSAHSRRMPCLTLEIGALDAYHFGQLFYFFQFACYLSCKLMGVNAFNQPGVEAYKKEMFKALGKED